VAPVERIESWRRGLSRIGATTIDTTPLLPLDSGHPCACPIVEVARDQSSTP